LFQKIQYAQAFADAGGQPYGDGMIVNVAYTLVFNMRGKFTRQRKKNGPTSRFILQQRIVNVV
jgi:hypothetical protein